MTVLVDGTPQVEVGFEHEYQSNGFFVLRNVFDASEMRDLLAEADRLLAEHRDLISPHNLRCRYMAHHETGEPLFEVFDPVNDISPVCERFCKDSRILSVIESLYGEAACLFKEKLIFKPPGGPRLQAASGYSFGVERISEDISDGADSDRSELHGEWLHRSLFGLSRRLSVERRIGLHAT